MKSWNGNLPFQSSAFRIFIKCSTYWNSPFHLLLRTIIQYEISWINIFCDGLICRKGIVRVLGKNFSPRSIYEYIEGERKEYRWLQYIFSVVKKDSILKDFEISKFPEKYLEKSNYQHISISTVLSIVIKYYITRYEENYGCSCIASVAFTAEFLMLLQSDFWKIVIVIFF